MQEPKCRDCKNERITAEKLEIIKDKEEGDLRTDLKEIIDRMERIREEIDYHATELSAAKQHWEDHNHDKKELIAAIKRWQNIKIVTEPVKKEEKIKKDKHQKSIGAFIK
jgi:hypothetical protein